MTIIGLLVAIGVPNLMKARDNSRLALIYNNLHQIEVAKITMGHQRKPQGTGDSVDNLAAPESLFFHAGGKITDVVSETYCRTPSASRPKRNLPSVVLGPFAAGTAIPAPELDSHNP